MREEQTPSTYNDSSSSTRRRAGPSPPFPFCDVTDAAATEVPHTLTGRCLPLNSGDRDSARGHKEWMVVGLRERDYIGAW